MKSVPLKFASEKTICPHCNSKSYVPLVSHDTGGKCFKCDVFDAPFAPQVDADGKIKKSTRGNNPNTHANLNKFTKHVPPTQADSKPLSARERGESPIERREHEYQTIDGDKLLKVIVSKYSDGEKTCFQQHWNGKEWLKGGVQSNELTLYRAFYLNMLQSAPQAQKEGTIIYVVEGEKDVETLGNLDQLATCNPMGASKWNQPQYSELLRGLHVAILPDNDTPGREHGKQVFQALQGVAASCKIVNLWELMPSLPEKGDVSDYIALGGDIAAIIAKVESTPIEEHETPPETERKQSFLSIKTMNKDITDGKSKPKMLKMFGELWRRGQSCLLFATDGAGKSALAVQIGDALARGESVCDMFQNECDPQRVLYFDFEFSDTQHANRYTVADTDTTYQFSDNLLRVSLNLKNPELIPENIERVIVKEIEALAIEFRADVLIIDNISALLAESEKSSTAGKLMKKLQSLKVQLNVSLLMIGHTPKRDGTRILTTNDLAGSKQLTNLIDNTIAIGKLPDEAGTRYLKHVKSRDGAPKYTTFNVVRCDIAQREDGFLRLIFGETANEFDLLKVDAPEESGNTSQALEYAKAFLLKELAGGAMPSKEIEVLLKPKKISWAKYMEARKELGVTATKFINRWEISLPPSLLRNGDTDAIE